MFLRASALVVACASFLAVGPGCSLDSGGVRPNDAGVTGLDGGDTDSGARDAGPDASAPIDAFVPDGCVPQAETCNMADDDCDGVPDDGIDLTSDPANCGRCGAACGAGLFCVRAACVGDVVDIAAGEAFNCAVRRDGAVFCWGNNDSEQLGQAGPSTGTPTAVRSVAGVVQVAAGQQHACALLREGSVTCWGRNDDAQLGRGSTGSPAAPATVPGLTGVTSVSAGWAHTCAVRGAAAELVCWGSSSNGQVGQDASGDPRPDPTTSPARSEGLPAPPSLADTGGDTTCAVLGGALYCWGRDGEGALGAGAPGDSDSPVRVSTLTGTVQALSVGDRTVCAVLDRAYCWGANGEGQIGDGSTDQRSTPAAVATALRDFVQLDVGFLHTCARRAAGGVSCWGGNSAGQLGTGSIGGMRAVVPTDVPGVTGVTKVVLGRQHTCALRASGSVACWGDASQGQIGRMGASSGSPIEVSIPPP